MTQERNTATTALLERPLTPRSLVGSLLLGMRPPRMPAGRLVEWCALFGVAEGTARVALSRMVDRGELVAHAGVYELAGHLRARQPVQEWSLAPRLARWNGDWLLAVVEPGARSAAERAALRDAARRLRLVELREAVWCRPANLPRTAAPADAWAVADEQCRWWTARPDPDAVGATTALFAPREWADRARLLERRLRDATEAVDPSDGAAIADAFVVGAAALAHVRADPLLPAELCGRRWPGDALRDGYRVFRDAFGSAVRGWFREQ
jgi:phenylacetic acid degradation operon negative regulatory protein